METLLKLCKKLVLPMLLYWCEKLHLLNLHMRKVSDDAILEIRCKICII